MKKGMMVLALFLTAALPVLAKTTVKTETKSFEASGLKSVSLDVPVGALKVVARKGSMVEIKLEVKCGAGEDCRDAASGIHLVSETKDGALNLQVKGWPKWGSHGMQVEMTILMPASLSVDAHLGVGQLSMDGLEQHARLEVGVGDATVHASAKDIKGVSMEVGVGDVSLQTPEGKPQAHGFIGKALDWQGGKGEASLHVEVGVGSAKVFLE
ncbi:MAG: hypothetical protein P8018_06695 [Acidobacteriota bacterium]|jgi:hypothetical protein